MSFFMAIEGATSLPQPDVLIGLSVSTPVLRQRMAWRGREMEATTTDPSLATLNTPFEHAYALWPGPLIGVDANSFDVFDHDHRSELAARVRQLLTCLES